MNREILRGAMSSENVEIVRLMWAGLERDAGMPWPPAEPEELDRRLRLDLCDQRIEIRNPPEFPVGTVFHGHDGVRQWIDDLKRDWAEFEAKPEQFLDLGDDRVLALGVWRARGRESGVPLDIPQAAWIGQFREGRLIRLQSFTERKKTLEAAGLSE